MARSNLAAQNPHVTHEGGQAGHQSPETELRRAVLSCLLFEDTFYEKGSDIAQRIADLCKAVPHSYVRDLAIEAREVHGLRHVSLWLALHSLRQKPADNFLGADTIFRVVKRPDETCELLAMYWRQGKKPIPAALRKGLKRAFLKFDAERLAKYDRDDTIKLRDVMFLVHPKPKDEAQANTFKLLAQRELTPPGTWEVALSSGADKTETWTRLLSENKLGALALLRNLRNMVEANVSRETIREALRVCNPWGVLPWQFVGAAKAAPGFESDLEVLLLKGAHELPKLPGKTLLLVDVSGSMDDRLSGRGERVRLDAACTLAMVAREVCEDVQVFTFSMGTVQVPARRGFALADAIRTSQEHSGTYLSKALTELRTVSADRLIVVTDEQSHDGFTVDLPIKHFYLMNVAPYKPGLEVGGNVIRINGWSDRLLDWIRTHETDEAAR